MHPLAQSLETLFNTQFALPPGGSRAALLVLVVAFLLGHVVAWVYMWTHTGLSYSRMFTMSQLVLPVLVSVFMMLVASNAFIALGMLAVFTMIRFRNVLKDTRDTMFILWALVEGLAVGTQHFALAIIATLAAALTFLYMQYTNFGSRSQHDAIVSLQWSGDVSSSDVLREILRRHARRIQLALQRESGEQRLDLAYHVVLRDPSRGRELLAELQATPGVERPVLHRREDESEI